MALLHRHRIEVDPGGRDPTSSDPNNRYCFGWSASKSQTRTVHKGNPSMIAWRPGDLYDDRRLCVLWRWSPGIGDVPGVMLNPHNPGDPAFGGWEPENSSGVSAWAIDFFGSQVYPNGASGLILRLQCQPSTNRHFRLATIQEVEAIRSAGGSFDIAIDMKISENFDAYVKVAVNGQWVQNLTNVKTCWRGQTAYWPYEGSYNSSGVPSVQTNSFLLARYGRTPEECLADGVSWPIEEAALWGAVQRADTSKPAWRHVVLNGVDHTQVVVPAEWGGGDPPPPPPPPPTGDFTWAPQNPLIGQTVTFAVKDPQAGVVYTWDRTLDGVADGVGASFAYAYQAAGEKTVVLMVGGQEVARHTLSVVPTPPPDPDPIGLHVVTQTTKTITLGWTPPAGQEGYLPTIDGSDKLTDGKRHPGTSETANSVRIGKPQDGRKHRYGVQVLGKIIESSVEA